MSILTTVADKRFDKGLLMGNDSAIASVRKIVGTVTFDELFQPPNGVSRLLLINNTGDIEFEWDDGTSTVVTITASGIWPIACTRILAAGTTVLASEIYWGY